MLIFLIGFMGCGKTFLAEKLAKSLAIPSIDLDDEIENGEKTSIEAIFEQHGEAHFRLLEQTYLKKIVSQNASAVVATGGGTPCFFDNLHFMKQVGATIYIQTKPELLCARLQNSSKIRPILQGKTGTELLAIIKEKLATREAFYKQADVIYQVADNGERTFGDLEKWLHGKDIYK